MQRSKIVGDRRAARAAWARRAATTAATSSSAARRQRHGQRGRGDRWPSTARAPARDPALVEKALGPVEPDADLDIVLAAIARADQDLDQATIDKALECWSNVECDTGTRRRARHGLRRRWRRHGERLASVSHMEAILQALTYPEIGTIVSTARPLQPGPGGRRQRHPVPVQSGVDFIVGYPDVGIALAGAVPRRRPPASRTCPSRRAMSDCPARRARSSPARTTPPCRRGPVRARRELRRRAQHRRRHRRGGHARRHAGERPDARLAAVRRARRSPTASISSTPPTELDHRRTRTG